MKEGRFDYVDIAGEHLTGNRRIVAEGVVIGGRRWASETLELIDCAAVMPLTALGVPRQDGISLEQ